MNTKISVLSTLFFMVVLQSAWSQTNCTSLDSSLIQLSHKYNVSISYSASLIPIHKKICLNREYNSVQEELQAIIKDSYLTYRKSGNGFTVKVDPSKGLVFGQILDKNSKSPIPYAVFYVPSLERGSQADENGRFDFSFSEKGTYKVEVSCVGYDKTTLSLGEEESQNLKIYLGHHDILPELLVDEQQLTTASMDVYNPRTDQSVPLHKLYHEASVLGQADVMRYMKLFPESNPASDGIASIRIKGGSQDQNLVLLNDVPVYHHSHGLGLHSIFNATNIDQASIHTNYFPARYQGKNSSVISVRSRLGDYEKHHIRLDASPYGINAAVDGPIIKDKLSFLISGRTTNVSSIRKKINQIRIEGESLNRHVNMSYADMNAVVSGQISPRLSFEIGGYYGRDKYKDVNVFSRDIYDYYYLITENSTLEDNFTWKNYNYYSKLKAAISDDVALEVQGYFTHFGYQSNIYEYAEVNDTNTLELYRFASKIEERGIKVQMNFKRPSFVLSELGGHLGKTNFVPGVIGNTTIDSTFTPFESLKAALPKADFDDFSLSSSESWLYAEKHLHIGKGFHMNLGLGSFLYRQSNKNSVYVQPRLNVQYSPNKKLNISASASVMNQQKHQLSSTNNGLPNELWFPATSNFKPQRSIQYGLNIESSLSDKLNLKLGGFYKKQSRLVKLPDAVFRLDASSSNLDLFDWEDIVLTGERRSFGGTTAVNYRTKKMEINTSYSYGKSNERFIDFIDNAWHPNYYHRDHQLASNLIWRPFSTLSITPAITYGSPNTLTFAPGQYQLYRGSTDEEFEIVESYDIYELTLEAFVRLDLSINYVIPGKHFIHRIKGSIFNIASRNNFSYYNLVDEFGFDPYSELPIFTLNLNSGPLRIYSINYTLSF